MNIFFYFFSFYILLGREKYIISENDYISNSVSMADQFRSEGKIYVVILILSIIFLFLIMYLFYLDRRISSLKKKLNNNKN